MTSQTNNIELWIVEDDEAQSALLRMLVKEVSPRTLVDVFDTGLKVLQALSRVSSSARIVILSDLNLTDMTGIQLLEELRKKPRAASIPFLLFTGTEDPEMAAQAYRKGANAYLLKPFELDALKALVESILGFWKWA